MKRIFVLAMVIGCMTGCHTLKQAKMVPADLDYSKKMITESLKYNTDSSKIPCTIDDKGQVRTVNLYDWRSGFFAGDLWYLYEFTKDDSFKKQAERWTAALEPLKNYTEHHDLGFMVYCSFGNGYRLTKNEAYKAVIVQAAKSLSTRFNEKTGSIKSWNSFKSWTNKPIVYNYPVIIDNMMNLEMLFFASKVTGDPYYRNIAVAHANSTLQNHFRADYSSYHVVCYDSATGKVIARETAQGYADESAWSRGQAWALYGFTMCYRETKDERYLRQAKGIAHYILSNKNLPADKVPYWDFNAGMPGYTPVTKSAASFNGKDQPRDASAAAIIASALLELSDYLPAKEAKKMKKDAVSIITSLSGETYLAKLNTNGNFLLKHSVGSLAHGGEIDVPLNYADYYYIEALMRLREKQKGGSNE